MIHVQSSQTGLYVASRTMHSRLEGWAEAENLIIFCNIQKANQQVNVWLVESAESCWSCCPSEWRGRHCNVWVSSGVRLVHAQAALSTSFTHMSDRIWLVSKIDSFTQFRLFIMKTREKNSEKIYTFIVFYRQLVQYRISLSFNHLSIHKPCLQTLCLRLFWSALRHGKIHGKITA